MAMIIRRWFCKHDFIKVKNNEYPSRTVTTYLCKKCGWIRKVKTFE